VKFGVFVARIAKHPQMYLNVGKDTRDEAKRSLGRNEDPGQVRKEPKT
jgi:hypothetical protein